MIEDKCHELFHAPETEEEIKVIQNLEKKNAALLREKNRKLKIWERCNDSSDKLTFGFTKAQNVETNEQPKQVTKIFEQSSTKKESMSELIEKKREMFFIQMSINTKREEIEKLNECARQKEIDLAKKEEMLEDDKIRFDAFLKENDKKACDMARLAEKEAKATQEINQEIKRISKQIQICQAEINKGQMELEVREKYKTFLDELSPPGWFEDQQKFKEARQLQRQQKRILLRKEQWRDEQRLKADELARKQVDELEISLKQQRRRRKAKEKKKPEETVSPELVEPDFEDEPITSSDEELQIFFKEPQQLLQKCSAYEEENIFLINTKHEADQTLDGLRRQFDEINCQIRNNPELDHSISDLRTCIQEEEDKIKETNKISQKASEYMPCDEAENFLNIIREKVKEVFIHCGLGDPGSKPHVLKMLENLEGYLHEIVLSLKNLPTHYILQAEKSKGKRRRDIKREAKQAAIKKAQEERNRKMIERSLQPPKQRKGKPVSLAVKALVIIIKVYPLISLSPISADYVSF